MAVVLLASAQPTLTADQSIVEEPRISTSATRILASGGGNAAYTSGFESLMVNPAAYAGNGEFTLLAAGVGLYAAPERVLRAPAAVLSGETPPMLGSAARLYTDRIDREGIGFSGTAGLGFAGGGLGLGIVGDFDAHIRDRNGEYDGHFLAEAGLVGGLALAFEAGPFDLSIGADIRPFVRIRSDLSDAEQVARFLDGEPFLEAFAEAPSLNGFGLGLNTGVAMRYRGLTAGLAIRDLGGTQVVYREHPLGEVITSAASGFLPPGGDNSGALYDPDSSYVLPAQVRIGLAWAPDFGDAFEPALFGELVDIHRLGSSGIQGIDVFSAGAEVTLGRFLTFRSGVNAQGFGLGGGISFGVVHVDGGLSFGRAEAPKAGLDASIRF
ncbi:MAG: hypothetical protein ACLFNQ_11395 [Spirochaetaceae bacterium]